MKIRYLLDGVSTVSDDTEVVCQSSGYYFVVVDEVRTGDVMQDGYVLLAILKDHIVSAVHEDWQDDPPFIREYFENNFVADIRFHLPHLTTAN